MSKELTAADDRCAWIVSNLVAGVAVEAEDLEALWEPWASIANAVTQANGRGRVNVLTEYCDGLDNGQELIGLVLAQNPRKKPP